ncbi:MAG: VanW family protein [Candidatus Moranbacteria bacterium]|nr:VanW family protein [Candidatus Moranbacteria bacterium]
MKRIFLIIQIVFFVLPFSVRAEEKILGNFSADEIQKIIGGPINFHVQDKTITADKNTLSGWLKIRSSLAFDASWSAEATNINYSPAASEPALQIFFRFIDLDQSRTHVRLSNRLTIDTDQLKTYLEKVKDDTRVPAEDAKLSFSGGDVSAFSLSKDGYEINSDQSLSDVEQALANDPSAKDITLPTDILKPEVTSTDLDKYGIKELVGEGVSNFRGSPKNRIHNVTTGASKFDGVLIKPNEEFSFIEALGPVDASTGYLPELVIKTDKTVPEYGGGMCQVSTTMFRAALNAGLEVTARTNHAYPVSYYNPQGLDATVYIPKPDLKFINNTPNYILVETRVEGTQLFFDFYGTSDGRETKIIGPEVLEKNGDGSMKTVAYQEVYDSDGNLIRKDTFKSNYKSPSLYPHPGEEKITEKPDNWSVKQWKAYKKANGMN